MRGKSPIVCSVLFACLSLDGSASAQSVRDQIPPDNRVWVTLGARESAVHDSTRIASHYLGYAILAGRAYDVLVATDPNRPYLHNPEADAQKTWPAELQTPPKKDVVAIGLNGRTWRLVGGQEGRPCLNGTAESRQCIRAFLGGLGVHFWRRHSNRTAGRCSEVVIAFRGTDFSVPGSLLSNVIPVFVFVRRFTGAGHYEQVKLNIDYWVDELKKMRCVDAKTRFVAVGHSLGGGLAKHAAFQNSRIGKVYTFNTSPVTAWSSIDRERQERNVKGLEIENVEERGDFLGALRGPANLWSPPRPCDPQERTITFNTLGTNPGNQHKIWPLAQKMYELHSLKKGLKRRQLALPVATPEERTTYNCIAESRDQYLARTERPGVPAPPPRGVVTVRPIPVELRTTAPAF